MANKSNLKTCLVISIFLLEVAAFTQARTITVGPGAGYDFDTIQAGIDAAGYGDAVSVAPGTYYENITLKNGINLLGAGADVTIIDANGYGDVVDVRANNVTISGFTLRNSGKFDLAHVNCGVYLNGSYVPIVRNNVIVNNRIGIGVWYGANPDIRNNIIQNNSNGLYIYGSNESPSNPAIINNTIVNNEENGITLRVMVSPIISNNIITRHITGINHNYVTGTPAISYNNLWDNDVNYMHDNRVDDTLAGPGSISVDPCFAEPGYWADVNDPNIAVKPNDPNAVWVDGDYHLKSQAGRWDPVSESWVKDDVTSPCIDAGDPNSDWSQEPWPHGERINMGAYGGTAEASMSLSEAGKVIYIQWLGHASVKVWAGDVVAYVDPRNLSISPHDATLVLVTHTHSDHYQPADIARVSGPQMIFIAPPDVVALYGKGQAIAPGQTIQFDPPRRVSVTAVPAYNTNKPNHPKSNNWVGFIVELAGRRIYVAGDTDLIPEMQTLGKINVAFLPISPAYTMGPDEAAQATMYIMPQLAVPYHWGTSTLADAQRFAQKAYCNVKIMSVGETLSSQDWLKDFSLVAHWKLDETAGLVAHDSASDKHGTVNGNPVWLPASGKIDGALQLDGDGDYVSTPFVLNPASGNFSVFAWIKGGAPGQVILSQTGGANWLCADLSAGKLMTSLSPPAGRFAPPSLVSESIITNGLWHRIGFVWDGSARKLYVDDIEVAKDTQTSLAAATGGLYFGAGNSLAVGSFWSGLIDDVRIHNRAVTP